MPLENAQNAELFSQKKNLVRSRKKKKPAPINGNIRSQTKNVFMAVGIKARTFTLDNKNYLATNIELSTRSLIIEYCTP